MTCKMCDEVFRVLCARIHLVLLWASGSRPERTVTTPPHSETFHLFAVRMRAVEADSGRGGGGRCATLCLARVLMEGGMERKTVNPPSDGEGYLG